MKNCVLMRPGSTSKQRMALEHPNWLSGPRAWRGALRNGRHYLRFAVIKKFLFARTNTLAQIQFFLRNTAWHCFGAVIFGTFVGGANPFSHERLRNVLSGEWYIAFLLSTSKESTLSLLIVNGSNRKDIQKYNNSLCLDTEMKLNSLG